MSATQLSRHRRRRSGRRQDRGGPTRQGIQRLDHDHRRRGHLPVRTPAAVQGLPRRQRRTVRARRPRRGLVRRPLRRPPARRHGDRASTGPAKRSSLDDGSDDRVRRTGARDRLDSAAAPARRRRRRQRADPAQGRGLPADQHRADPRGPPGDHRRRLDRDGDRGQRPRARRRRSPSSRRPSLPLGAALGDELAEVFLELHTEHGVTFKLDAQVSALTVDGGRATGVDLADGEHLDADVIIVGVGAAPNVELAEAAGLEVDNGVLVDASLRTSDPSIYAVGDIANHDHPSLGARVRVEHWANALNQPAAAAAAIVGNRHPYDELPYFYTDQYDLGHGVRRVRASGLLRRGRDPWRPRRPRVHRLLARRRRPCARRHERQRLGRRRRRQGTDPSRPARHGRRSRTAGRSRAFALDRA